MDNQVLFMCNLWIADNILFLANGHFNYSELSPNRIATNFKYDVLLNIYFSLVIFEFMVVKVFLKEFPICMID